jgi:hypothetical protein
MLPDATITVDVTRLFGSPGPTESSGGMERHEPDPLGQVSAPIPLPDPLGLFEALSGGRVRDPIRAALTSKPK